MLNSNNINRLEYLKSLVFNFNLNDNLPEIGYEIKVRKEKIENLLNKMSKSTDKKQINKFNFMNFSTQNKIKNTISRKIIFRTSKSTITNKQGKTPTSLFQDLTDENALTAILPKKQYYGTLKNLSYKPNHKDKYKKIIYQYGDKQNKTASSNFINPFNSRNKLSAGFISTESSASKKYKKLSSVNNNFQTYCNNVKITNDNDNRKSISYSSKKKFEISPQITFEYNPENINKNNNNTINTELPKTDRNYYNKTLQAEEFKRSITSSDINKNIPSNDIRKQLLIINKDSKNYFKKLNSISNLNYSKTKRKINKIEKLIKKDEIKASILDILKNKKQKKINFSSKIKKIKEQVNYLITVDRINRLPDNYPTEQLGEFDRFYKNRVKQIGISNRNITLSNGKLYHQSKAQSKTLSKNCKENNKKVNKLLLKLKVDKSEYDKQSKRSDKLLKSIHREKFNLSPINK